TRSSGSSVRYEAIRRADPITSEALWGHNDDHDRLDDLQPPEEQLEGERVDTDPPMSSVTTPSKPRIDDTPLEDRPSARRPTRQRMDKALDASVYSTRLIEDGLAFPYPANKFFRGFGPCRGRRHHHEGIDLGGVGPEWGIGTPIRSMSKAEILFIGTGEDDPDQFGSPDKRPGEALRGDKMLPRSREIEGYGKVYFFTRTKGRWRSGNIMVTRAIDGPLEGHTIRYLHLAAFRPDLKVGDVLEVGEELGLMGGTGVQESAPHLHLDIAAPDGKRVDVAPMLGLAPTASCKDKNDRDERDEPRVLASRERKAEPAPAEVKQDKPKRVADQEPERLAARNPKKSHDPYAHLEDEQADKRDEKRAAVHSGGRLEVARCKSTKRSDDFASGRFDRHVYEVELDKKGSFSVELKKTEGKWKPRLEVDGGAARTLASGKLGGKAVSSVKADAGTLKIEISGWDGQPPTDASYTLVVKEKCRR
ncbi:MAG TPA: M23 family metallopeptidase, partial [Myxococcota bacterium]|nr:M23 family metallopeptidase [Myxococcota bacterium]